MGKTIAKCVVAMGGGLALMVAQGCRKQAAAPAPVQPVVRSVPRVQPDFPVGPLPVEDVYRSPTRRVDRTARQQQVQPVEAQNTDAQAAAVAAQRQRDAALLQQQQADSQRQQQELNRDIEERLKMQQEVQAEPRIQDSPGATLPPPPTQPQ